MTTCGTNESYRHRHRLNLVSQIIETQCLGSFLYIRRRHHTTSILRKRTLTSSPSSKKPRPRQISYPPRTSQHRLKKEDASATSSSNIKDHFPLEYLEPPEPPADGPYRSFGEIWQTEDKLPTLSDTGIKQLYSNSEGNQDRIFELKKLLHSLLIQFIELAGIMSISPESFPAKIEDIRVLLINMHHLLNEYRPHQSRESLILSMESQLEDKRREIADLKQKNEQVQNKVADLTKQFDSVLLEKNEKSGVSSNSSTSRRKSRTTSVVEERVDETDEGKKPSIDDLQWQLLDFQPT